MGPQSISLSHPGLAATLALALAGVCSPVLPKTPPEEAAELLATVETELSPGALRALAESGADWLYRRGAFLEPRAGHPG